MVKKVAELHDRNPEVTKIIFRAIGEITRTATRILKDLKNVDEKSVVYAERFIKLEVRVNNSPSNWKYSISIS